MQKAPKKCQPEINKVFNKFSIFVAKIKQNFGDLNKVQKATYIVIII